MGERTREGASVWRGAWQVGALVAAGLCIAQLRSAGAASWATGVGLGMSYNDHRSRLGEPANYAARTVTPRLRVNAANPLWRLDVFAERRFEFYSGASLDSLVGSSDHTADRASLALRRNLSPLDHVKVQADYGRSRDLLDIDQGTVAVAGDVERWLLGASGMVWRGEGSYRLKRKDYESGAAEDVTVLDWTARALPLRLATGVVYAGWSQKQLELGDVTALRRRNPHVGYRRVLTPLLTADLQAGAAEVLFSDGARQRKPAVSLGLTRSEDAPVSFAAEVGFEGDSLSLARLGVSRRLGNGRIWLSGESLADAEGGISRTPTLTRRLVAGVRDTLGRANVLGFESSYEHALPLHFTGPRAEVLRASGWLLRRIQPWLSARIGASYLRQPVGNDPGVPVYRRVRMDAELTAMLP